MPARWCIHLTVAAALILTSLPSFASAYNAHPKLVVVIVIDQFRGDYLERYRDLFGEGGFRLFLDHGANFTDCNYDYANTRTAPGHATLFTGAYSNGHGIAANEWWDPKKKRVVTSVEDDATKLVGVAGDKTGSSPHNLLADTVGDELKLATQGQARVFGLSLKDRAAVLPAGFAADAAYWIEPKSGAWVTSTYYRPDLPKWAQDFNSGNRAAKYWDRDWKNSNGDVLRSTAHRKNKDGSDAGFYEIVGATPFANEYELEFAKELVATKSSARGRPPTCSRSAFLPTTFSAIRSAPIRRRCAMALALDRELADFFTFLGHQVGLANLWIALSADHGVSALPKAAKKLRIPAANLDAGNLDAQINNASDGQVLTRPRRKYIKLDYPIAWLDEDAFAAAHVKEHDAETAVGEAMKQADCATTSRNRNSPKAKSPQALSAEVSEQLLTRRGLVCDGSSRTLHRRSCEGHRPRVALHLRHPRAPGFLRAAFSPRNLSHPCRTHRSGGHAGIAARHQRSYPRRGTRAHRGPRPRIARKTQMSFLILRAKQ